jgi:molybdate-binding protein
MQELADYPFIVREQGSNTRQTYEEALNRQEINGLNEFAGYLSVAFAALASGYIAAKYVLRP